MTKAKRPPPEPTLLEFLAALVPPQEPDPATLTEPGDTSAPPPPWAKSVLYADLVGLADPSKRAGDPT